MISLAPSLYSYVFCVYREVFLSDAENPWHVESYDSKSFEVSNMSCEIKVMVVQRNLRARCLICLQRQNLNSEYLYPFCIFPNHRLHILQ